MKQSNTDFLKGIDALLAGREYITRPTDANYVHTNPETGEETKLMRCTNFYNAFKPWDGPAGWEYAAKMGTDADQLCRDYFVEGIDYVREQASKNAYPHLTKEALIQLVSSIRTYDEAFVKPGGWKVLADRVFFYSLELGVAGEVDLLLYNETTQELRIVDMKTNRNMDSSDRKIREKYRLQLNVYRKMAEEMSGLKVTGLEIMWIATTYERFDEQTTTAFLARMQEVPMEDVIPHIEKTWQKRMGMSFRDYSFDTPKAQVEDTPTELPYFEIQL